MRVTSIELSVPATSTLRLSLAWKAFEAPVPPSATERSVIPVIDPPVIDPPVTTILSAFCIAIFPSDNEDLTSLGVSETNFVPSPTMNVPSRGSRSEIVVRLSFSVCLESN